MAQKRHSRGFVCFPTSLVYPEGDKNYPVFLLQVCVFLCVSNLDRLYPCLFMGIRAHSTVLWRRYFSSKNFAISLSRIMASKIFRLTLVCPIFLPLSPLLTYFEPPLEPREKEISRQKCLVRFLFGRADFFGGESNEVTR